MRYLLILVSITLLNISSVNASEKFGVVWQSKGPVEQVGVVGIGTLKKEVDLGDFKVSISDTGAWKYDGYVKHLGLRCAKYRTGILLGKSESSYCADVEWLGKVNYGATRRQCNSAKVHHKNQLVDPVAKDSFGEIKCVKIVVECKGNCKK